MTKRKNETAILKKIEALEQELLKLKKDILHFSPMKRAPQKIKSTLFGSIHCADINNELIEKSKKNLFRELDDI